MSEPKDIFSLNETAVTLTYAELGVPPITFYLRPFLQKEEQDLRQAHFALTEGEREKTQHAHNVEMLVRLSTKAPLGLPGVNGKKDFGETLRALLIDPAPMKVKVVADALTRYYRVTQPAEFFRGL